jgi:hypothetical protein
MCYVILIRGIGVALAGRALWEKGKGMHVRRDSVEGIVFAVFAGGEGAPVERRGARQDN